MKEKIKKRIKELKNIINEANINYHTLDAPTISDYEYDKYLSELVNLEEENPEFKTIDSPTNKVGGTVLSKFEKVKHSLPMLSLSNVFSIEELKKFCLDISNKTSQIDFIFEEKIDGLAINLEYRKGLFYKASTRGDGLVGEDVTSNIKTIKTIPLKLNKEIDILVRGEVFLSKDAFNKLNNKRKNEGQELFANPRNATAGTIRQLDSKVVSKRNLDCFLYSIPEISKYNLKTQKEVLEFLSELGFKINTNYKITNNLDEVESIIEYFEKRKETNSFQTDGVVVKFNNLEEGLKLGFTSKFPKSQTAYKFPPTLAKTKLKNIIYQVGRLGVITPVAILEPVLLEGSIISKATLHNFLYIKEKDIRINDTVYIYKAGEIIPKVLKVDKKDRKETKPVSFITTCPSCNESLKTEENGIITYCVNENCKSREVAKLVYFSSRPAMNIVGLGEKTVKLLYENNLLKDIISIYNLKNKKEEILKIKGFAKKGVDKLLLEIEESKKKSFKKVFSSLGIKNVGFKVSEIIVEHFKSFENIKNATVEDFISVNEIGEEIASSICNFFKDERTKLLTAFLVENNFNLEENKKENNIFSNWHFVISGTLEKYKRDDIKEDIEKNGGRFTSQITKKTNFLILGKDPSNNKVSQAKEKKVKIINEKEYEELKKIVL